MKNLFKSVSYFLSAVLFAGLVSMPAAKASYDKGNFNPAASKQGKLSLKYAVYAGGFRALNASLVMDLGKKAYDMELDAETQGFIGGLFPWKASLNTSGHTENGIMIPTVHTGRSTWREKLKVTEMNYAPDGRVLKTTTQADGKTTTDRNIDQKAAHNAMDLLTGTLLMLQNVKNNASCAGSFPVFDGKRRYNITMTDGGKEILPHSKYSTFEGEAIRCTLEVEPVVGFNEKDQKRGWLAVQNHTEQHHKLPTLWFAAVKGSTQIVPVRMEIASDYGSVVAHLSSETVN